MFNPEEGAIGGFSKVSSSQVWSKTNSSTWVQLYSNDGSRIIVRHDGSANVLNFYYCSGGTIKSTQIPITNTDWFHWMISWSKSHDQLVAWINGVPSGIVPIFNSGQVFDATDSSGSNWVYSNGWNTYDNGPTHPYQPYDNTYHWSQTAGDYFDIDFIGDHFTLYYIQDEGFGDVNIYVDNQLQQKLSQNGSKKSDATYISSHFGNGQHTIKFQVIGNGRVTFDAIELFDIDNHSVVGMYDDVYPVYRGTGPVSDASPYGGSWTPVVYTYPYGDKIRYSLIVGAEATFSFFGAQFTLYYLKDSDYGILDIFLDNNLIHTLDQSGAPATWQEKWTSPVFAESNHVVKFKMKSGAKVNIDAVRVNVFSKWVGALDPSRTFIGGNSQKSLTFSGWMSDVIMLNREPTYPEALSIATINQKPQVISIIGDDYSANEQNGRMVWPYYLSQIYNSGNCGIINHAEYPSFDLKTYLPNQIKKVISSHDDPDIIILSGGDNEDNSTASMTQYQSILENAFSRLKRAYPMAKIYIMNVWPNWTDNTGNTEIDRSNIRQATLAAAVSQNVTCWDTYTDRWFTPSDTWDGVYPNDSGHQRIANRVAALLQK